VTTKSEPTAIAADPSVAAEPVAPARASGEAPLPSIIVDPQALGPSDAPDAPAPPEGATAEAAENGAGMSDFEAERFATSYRASWEPGEALDAPLPVVAPTPAAPTSGAPPRASDRAPAIEPIVLPGNARLRGLALTALAVLAFVGLVALALSSTGRPSAPPSATEATPAPAPAPANAPAPAIVAEPPVPAPAPEVVAAPIEAIAGAAAVEATAGAAAAPVVAGAIPPATPETAAPTEPPAAPPAIEPAAVAAPEPPPAAPPAAPLPTVRVQIETSPADAQLTIDGVQVPNPFDQQLPKGSDKHRIAASSAGHESREQLVGFERKRDLMLRLKALPAPVVAKPTPSPAPAPVAKPTRTPRPARSAPVKTAKKPAAAPEPSRKGAAFVSESPY
jgi:hypothetical protein